MLDSATTTQMISDMFGNISDVIAGALPTVLLLLGTLIGLFFVIRVVLKRIGRAK